jgi:ligand-binding sensor domain-containing protein/two-component sensor histidine kinase
MFGKTIIIKNILFLTHFFLIGLTLKAQPDQIFFDHFGINEGFTSREARFITTDKKGMVWISSSDGLVRYDSKSFKFYQNIIGDTNSITHNYCNSLQIDKRGWIWVVADNDLDVFDPKTEQFRHVKFKNSKNELESVTPISFYYDSKRDVLWITTHKGLFISKGGSLQLQSCESLIKNKAICNTVFGTMINEGSDYLWLTSMHKIYKLNINTGITEIYEIPEQIKNIKNDRSFFNCRSMFLDEKKTLWLGTWINGLLEFNTITKTFNQYVYSDHTKNENTIYSIITTDLPGQEDLLWLSAHHTGLNVFNKKTKQFTNYSKSTSNSNYTINGAVYGIFHQPNDAMWIASENGFHRYDYNKQIFNKINLTSISEGIDLYPVGDMFVVQNKEKVDEQLWMHIPYKDGYIYDLKQKKINPLPPKVAKYLDKNIGFWTMYLDSRNIAWISTTQFGIIGYDISADKIIVSENSYFKGRNEWATLFFEDKKNQLWIGTFKGLYKMEQDYKSVSPINEVNLVLAQKELSTIITGINEDNSGKIWFTADFTDTRKASIGNYNPKTKKFNLIFNEKDDITQPTPILDFRDIIVTPSGKVFVNTASSGLVWFQTGTDKIKFNYLGNEQGFNTRYIESMKCDSVGNIWISNDFGLGYYKIPDNSFVNFSFNTYPLGTNNLPSMYISPQTGTVYLGESNAVDYLQNTKAVSNTNKSSLLFIEFKVNNKVYRTPSGEIVNGSTIVLEPDENMVSIEFALLSYINSRDNLYSWKLEGVDKEWKISKNNIASYNSLAAGTYTLWVKAANNYGEWTKSPLKLKIKIKQRFYKTWWFILICLLAIAGLIYWTIQRRINRLKEKYKLRNTIAADLHDEIGSTLTSISILSTISQQAMDLQPKQTKDMLEQIATQSKSIQQNMSDIVWSIRPDNERIENLIIRMREFAAVTLEPLNIKTTITADDRLIAKILPMHFRKEILLIYKEAVNNISKHANASNVVMQMTNGGHEIKLLIHDDGTWKGHNTGTGTKTMKERAHKIGGQLTIAPSDKGTLVVLTIPIS